MSFAYCQLRGRWTLSLFSYTPFPSFARCFPAQVAIECSSHLNLPDVASHLFWGANNSILSISGQSKRWHYQTHFRLAGYSYSESTACCRPVPLSKVTWERIESQWGIPDPLTFSKYSRLVPECYIIPPGLVNHFAVIHHPYVVWYLVKKKDFWSEWFFSQKKWLCGYKEMRFWRPRTTTNPEG